MPLLLLESKTGGAAGGICASIPSSEPAGNCRLVVMALAMEERLSNHGRASADCSMSSSAVSCRLEGALTDMVLVLLSPSDSARALMLKSGGRSDPEVMSRRMLTRAVKVALLVDNWTRRLLGSLDSDGGKELEPAATPMIWTRRSQAYWIDPAHSCAAAAAPSAAGDKGTVE